MQYNCKINFYKVGKLFIDRISRNGLQAKTEHEKFTVVCSRSPQSLEFSHSCSRRQGHNDVYRIRDQRQKIGWDLGSQARDLGSQAVGSGSVMLRGDQGSSFPTENQIS